MSVEPYVEVTRSRSYFCTQCLSEQTSGNSPFSFYLHTALLHIVSKVQNIDVTFHFCCLGEVQEVEIKKASRFDYGFKMICC